MTMTARLGRKNKRGDRKGESNDSPEIPDKRVTSDVPGLPLGTKDRYLTSQTQSTMKVMSGETN